MSQEVADIATADTAAPAPDVPAAAPDAAPDAPAAAIEAASDAELLEAADAALRGTDAADDVPDADAATKPGAIGAKPDDAPSDDPPKPDAKPDDEPIGDIERKTGSRAWEHKQLRRKQQQQARAEADYDARVKALAEKEAAAAGDAELAKLMTLNPIKAAEELAKRGGLRGDEFLERLQRAYVKGDDGGQADVRTDLAEIKAEIKALNEARAAAVAERKEAAQADALAKQKTSWVDGLAKQATNGGGYTYLAAAMKADPEKTRRAMADAVETICREGWEVAPEDLLDELDKQEKASHDHYSAMQAHLSGSVPGQGHPAGQPAKPASAQRTVTPHDVANSGGAQRELTPEERLLEADKLLR